MRLLLVRHAQVLPNVLGQLATAAPGPDLTPVGVSQAEALPLALADEKITRLYASPVVRTQQTAAPLARALGVRVEVCAGLREVEAGDLEMRSDPEAMTRYRGIVRAWAEGDPDRRMPGAGTGRDFFTRFDDAVRAIRAATEADGEDVTAVAVSHASAVRCWVASRAINAGDDFMPTHALKNTGVATLAPRPDDRWELLDWHTLPIGGPAPADAAPASCPVSAR